MNCKQIDPELLEELEKQDNKKGKIAKWWSDFRCDYYYEFNKFDDIFVHPFRKIKYGIINFWVWKDIIWSDRNWDQAFMFYIWKRKFEAMKKFWEGGNSCSEKGRIHDNVHSLRICIKLIDRILNDDYVSGDWDRHWAKFGKLKFGKENPITNSEGKVFAYEMKNDKELNDIEEEESRVDIRRMSKKSDDMRERDKKRLMTIVNHFEGVWWD